MQRGVYVQAMSVFRGLLTLYAKVRLLRARMTGVATSWTVHRTQGLQIGQRRSQVWVFRAQNDDLKSPASSKFSPRTS